MHANRFQITQYANQNTLHIEIQFCLCLHLFLITDFLWVLVSQGDRCYRIRSPGSDTSPFLPLAISLTLSLFPFPHQSKTSSSPARPNLERVSAIPVDWVMHPFCADLGSAVYPNPHLMHLEERAQD